MFKGFWHDSTYITYHYVISQKRLGELIFALAFATGDIPGVYVHWRNLFNETG